MTELSEISEELILFFTLTTFSDNVVGVNLKRITEKKYAIPLQMKDGSLFGITVEKLN